MKGPAWILFQPYKFLVVIPCLILLTLTLGSAGILISVIFRIECPDYLARLWSRMLQRIAFIMVQLVNKHHFDKNGSYVIVSNRRSIADIPVIHGCMGLKIKWVMKKESGNIPIFGTACEKLGCILVDRSNPEMAIRSIESARKRLSKNASVLFFAEGKRSRDGRLPPFRKGAFHFALAAGLPILPVTVTGTYDILPPGGFNLMPGMAEIIVHPPFHLIPGDRENLDDIAATARRIIESAL